MKNLWDNLYYSLTFLWIVKFGCKEIFKRSPINFERLPNLPTYFDAEYLFKQFSVFWDIEKFRIPRGNKPRLWVSLLRIFRSILVVLLVLTLVYLLLYFSSIVILIWLIRGLENIQLYRVWHLIGIAVLFTFCNLCLNFCSITREYGLKIIGMKCRVLLTTAIFHRIQEMSYDQVQTISSGHIITIITSDLFKFDHAMSDVANLFLTPPCILLIVITSSLEIGWPAVLILPLFAIHLFIVVALAVVNSHLYKKALKYS